MKIHSLLFLLTIPKLLSMDMPVINSDVRTIEAERITINIYNKNLLNDKKDSMQIIDHNTDEEKNTDFLNMPITNKLKVIMGIITTLSLIIGGSASAVITTYLKQCN